jgi:hypothetical protein
MIGALIALLRAIPAARDLVSLFVRQWIEYDQRAREKEALDRRDKKLAAARRALDRSAGDGLPGSQAAPDGRKRTDESG